MTRKKTPDPVAESPPPVDLPPVDPTDEAGLTNADYSTAFTPRNVAIGLAIVAGLVAIAASRRRRRPDPDDVIELDV